MNALFSLMTALSVPLMFINLLGGIVAGVNPQAFQKALANWAEALIAEGAPNIAPSRSVGELGKFYEIWRKASGLDGGHNGKVPFIRALGDDKRLTRVKVAPEIVILAEDRLHLWHQLREFAGDHLARYKLPLRLHIVDALPRNPAGKVLKFVLKEELAD